MELLKDLGIFTIISGLITFLIQSFIRKYFDKQADLYKTELQKDLQQYKSDLDIHLTKASRFHEKRLNVISELYKKMAYLKVTLATLTSSYSVKLKDPIKNRERNEERQKKAGDSYQDFLQYYFSQRIFIPKETCEIIDELSNQAWSVIFDYHWREDNYGDDFPEESREIVKEINKRIRENIPQILEKLEDDFRLSVDVESS